MCDGKKQHQRCKHRRCHYQRCKHRRCQYQRWRCQHQSVVPPFRVRTLLILTSLRKHILWRIMTERKHFPHIRGRRLTFQFKKRAPEPEKTVNLLSKARSQRFELPDQVDWSSKTGPVRDQGEMGCCVSFSLCTVARFLLKRDREKPYILSPLFLYWIIRVKLMQKDPTDDSGTTLDQACKALFRYGVCREELCPFDADDLATSPSKAAFQDARKHRLITYAPVAQNLETIQSCLAAGFLVNVGIQLFPSVDSDKVMQTGVIPMPDKGERAKGGHALVICGYINSKQRFILQNSWGPNVGRNGFFTIPYAYILNPNLCSEIFCLTDFDNL